MMPSDLDPATRPIDGLIERVEPWFEPVAEGVDQVSGLFPAGVVAFQTHRRGGVSEGAYASFNLAGHVGDQHEAVEENRARLENCCATNLTWLDQTHGVGVVEIDPSRNRQAAGFSADAALTANSGQACVVMTADCLPILIAQSRFRSVLAVHAGWRGIAAGVIEAGLSAAASRRPGPDQWTIWLGPCIGPHAYEVGNEVRQVFINQSACASSAFRESTTCTGKFYADLRTLAEQRILRWFACHPEVLLTAESATSFAGRPLRIARNTECTYRDSDRYYSFRRQSVTGRMASLIALQPI